MTGSLLQIVAKGVHDLYLIGDPQITLFLVVYRRIGNFSMYDHTFDIKGGSFGSEFQQKLDKMGDLLHKLWIVYEIPDIKLTRKKATFEYIASILKLYGISWTYTPQSSSSIVTLHNYNGESVNLSAEQITVDAFSEGDTSVTFTSGTIYFEDGSYKKAISSTINLEEAIADNFDTEFGPSKDLQSVDVEISSGTITLIENSFLGNAFPIASGTLTLNKEKIIVDSVTSYIYYVTDVSIVSTFEYPIVDIINAKIISLLENYNFFINSLIVTKHSDYVINKSVDIFDNLDPSDENVTVTSTAETIKSNMYSGRNFFMYLFQEIISKYSKTYSYDDTTYFLPKLSNSYVLDTSDDSTKTIHLYSESFKNTMRSYGLILGAIYAYSYDVTTYNANYIYSYQTTIDNGGNILTSTDSGTTWITTNISSTIFNEITISVDGINQSIVDESGNIYVTSTMGTTWSSAISVSSIPLKSIAMSSDGEYQTSVGTNTATNAGYIYVSTDKWNTSTLSSVTIPSDSFFKVIITLTGQYQTIISTDGKIYTSIDYGENWVDKGDILVSSGSTIVDFVESSDGTLQIAISSDGKIYISTNYWESWSTITLTISDGITITTISCSSTGIKQTIGDSAGNIYISSSSGATWSNAYNVCSNAINHITIGTTDGKMQIVNDISGNIYTSSLYGTTWSDATSISSNVLGCITYIEFTVPDAIDINLDSSTSSPLFDEILTRSTTELSTAIKFSLYNSDDLRSLLYITYINNIVRQKIIKTSDEHIPFNPILATTLKTSDMQISDDNLLALDPDIISLDDVILFYHTIDPDINKYAVYSYQVGGATDVYFDDNIGANYKIYDKYSGVIQTNRDSYTTTDSYKIYKSYIQDLINNDAVNNKISSAQQVAIIAEALKYNVDSNIRYNFGQTLNNMLVLSNGLRTISDHYILTFYRPYILSNNKYISTAGLSFSPIIDSTSNSLKDQFKNIINTVINVQVPDEVVVNNYFNDYIQTQIKTLIVSCQGLLRATNYDAYINEFALWARAFISSGSLMDDLYTYAIEDTTYPAISTSTFGSISLMNYIPLLAAKDIPVMIYNTFSKYTAQIMIDYGLDTSSDSTQYTTFMDLIDFRDNDAYDRTPPLPDSIATEITTTKKAIYERIVASSIVTTYDDGSNYVVDKSSYYSQLRADKASDETVILSFSMLPSTFLCPYSTQDDDGNLVDSSTADEDITNLPIEWLTQTYYQIFKAKISSFVDTHITDTDSTENKSLKQLLNGMVCNVVNCFILRNGIPSFTSYKNNNYSLLGLNTETNSSIKKYKQPNESITVTSPIYCDCISSIWYQVTKGYIQLYNKIFNETLISSNYYKDNLGTSMGSIFDYIKSTVIGDDLLTPYYEKTTNDYPISLPTSLLDSFVNVYKNDFSTVTLSETDTPTDEVIQSVLEYIGERYPAVDTSQSQYGFDFYRLNIGDPDITTSKAYKINTYVTDYSQLYSYLINYYNSHKNITSIKNDIDNISSTTYGSLRKSSYAYDKTSTLIEYFNEHINESYIENITSESVKTNLTTLNTNAASYWNPGVIESDVYISRNKTGIYGILDVIYNSNLDGNIIDTINKLSIIPSGKSSTDVIDFTQNPFTSYCLRIWYANLQYNYSPLLSASEFTYQDLIDAVLIFTNNVYTTVGSTTTNTITSSSILKNSNIAKLYTEANVGSFPNAEYVSWFIFDIIFSNSQLNDKINSTKMLQTIQKTSSSLFNVTLFSNSSSSIDNDNGAVDTLQTLITKFFSANTKSELKQLQTITQFKSTADTATINNISQRYNILNDSSNTDISFYVQSLDGNYVVNAPLEKRLLNLLSVDAPSFSWVKELGHKIAKNLSIYIDDQQIETYTPELMHLEYTTTKDSNHERGYNILIGNTEDMYTPSSKSKPIKKIYVPLSFWFCKSAGNSLPMVNLLATTITLRGEIDKISNLLYTDDDVIFKKTPKIKTKLMARYIYLDDDERKRMVGSKLEYLIEKYNYCGVNYYYQKNLFRTGGNLLSTASQNEDFSDSKPTAVFNINTNDPIKYFIWYMKFTDKTTTTTLDVIDWTKFGYNVRDADGVLTNIKETLDTILFDMNGVPREQLNDELFYSYLQPYNKQVSSLNEGEFMYCFSLYPILLQPTGTANYSEIAESKLIISFKNEIIELFKNNPNLELKIEMWGKSYNIVRFISGMGGLAFTTT